MLPQDPELLKKQGEQLTARCGRVFSDPQQKISWARYLDALCPDNLSSLYVWMTLWELGTLCFISTAYVKVAGEDTSQDL